ncbi:hypothetical protein Barb7_02766 [Bacteroidales bacterium Barb7]|nr:hypothetical protein Barb7_02766 [Bacteroidales bacterium Barb7]
MCYKYLRISRTELQCRTFIIVYPSAESESNGAKAGCRRIPFDDSPLSQLDLSAFNVRNASPFSCLPVIRAVVNGCVSDNRTACNELRSCPSVFYSAACAGA